MTESPRVTFRGMDYFYTIFYWQSIYIYQNSMSSKRLLADRSARLKYLCEKTLLAKRERQARLANKIKQTLQPSSVRVDDMTIGTHSCGDMFNIAVESPHFMGKTLVEQHRMVVECLQDDIKSIHSYNLKTKAPHSNGQQNGQEWSKRVL